MSKTYTQVKSEVERSVLVAMTCDLCGKQTRRHDWTEGFYRVAETTIECRVGTSYPEGGSGKLYDVDICPGCFRDKLIPWLQSQGAAVRETEWDR